MKNFSAASKNEVAAAGSEENSDSFLLAEFECALGVVRDRVRGVVHRHHTGLYLFGPPGTSKSYTVVRTLEELQAPHQVTKGHLTPMGLFDLLAENRDGISVLDDVSELLTQGMSLQLLLGALGNQADPTTPRTIRYKRQKRDVRVEFMGGIIFISNLGLNSNSLQQALKSRVQYLRHDPSESQIAALMRKIASKRWPESRPKLSARQCAEVAEFLIAESKRLGCRLDIRHLVDKAFPDYFQYLQGQAETDWRDLVTSTLREAVVDLQHSSAKSRRQADRINDEHGIVREILTNCSSPKDRLNAWKERTGGKKSERAFYRRCRELGASTIGL